MPARLVPLAPGAAPTVSLQRPVVFIGRHPECDCRLDLPQVSRRHCCVILADDRLSIRDLGSRNGVRVNGRLVEESRLHHGDEVAIAQLLFRLEDLNPAPLAPVTTAPASASALAQSPDDDSEEELVPLTI